MNIKHLLVYTACMAMVLPPATAIRAIGSETNRHSPPGVMADVVFFMLCAGFAFGLFGPLVHIMAWMDRRRRKPLLNSMFLSTCVPLGTLLVFLVQNLVLRLAWVEKPEPYVFVWVTMFLIDAMTFLWNLGVILVGMHRNSELPINFAGTSRAMCLTAIASKWLLLLFPLFSA